MRRLLGIAAVVAVPGFAAEASDAWDSTLKSRALEAAAALSPPPRSQPAPFLQNRDPMPELLMRDEPRRAARATCRSFATDLCYDLAEGRIVYRAARQYLPKIDGLEAESVSLRRNRLVVKYSFR
jgi:hypothetical protein